MYPFRMIEVQQAMDRLLSLTSTPVDRRWVAAGDAAVHLLAAGSGLPLLLLHGGGGGAANWYRVLDGLAPSFHLFAPDLPGFGLTADIILRPPLGVQAAHVLRDLLDALELPRISVLGTSFGGLAGLRLAQHFPERVDRLVLLDSAGLARGVPWPVRLGTWPPVARLALRPSQSGGRWVLRRWLTSTRLEPDHERALVDWLVAVGRAHTNEALALFAGWRGQREVLDPAELQALRLPVLVLWGERDRFFPLAQAAAAVGHLPAGRLQVIPGAGHSPNWECPAEVVVAVRRFLAH